MHDAIPSVVGDFLGDQRHNRANDDGQQHIVNGLLVRRKAHNPTAFTDGYRTWANHSDGVRERLNTPRFPLEADAASLLTVTGKP